MDLIFTAKTLENPVEIRKLSTLRLGQSILNVVDEHGLQKMPPVWKIKQFLLNSLQLPSCTRNASCNFNYLVLRCSKVVYYIIKFSEKFIDCQNYITSSHTFLFFLCLEKKAQTHYVPVTSIISDISFTSPFLSNL